jgi:hypothetical protein
MLLLVGFGAASDPCSGNDNWQNDCTGVNAANVCGQAGVSRCMMSVYESNNGVKTVAVATQPGQTSPIICVTPQTVVAWSDPNIGSRFFIDFGGSTPFLKAYSFTGNAVTPQDGDTIGPNNSPNDLCYPYSVKHCKDSNACTTSDPKVIVQGMGGGPPLSGQRK